MKFTRMLLIGLFVIVGLFCIAANSEAASATLSWTDNSNNEMGFNIERKAEACTGTGPFAALAGVTANSVTYKDVTVSEGATYCYRVNAWNTVDGTANGVKQYSAWSNSAGITLPFGAPVVPSQLGVVAGP